MRGDVETGVGLDSGTKGEPRRAVWGGGHVERRAGESKDHTPGTGVRRQLGMFVHFHEWIVILYFGVTERQVGFGLV